MAISQKPPRMRQVLDTPKEDSCLPVTAQLRSGRTSGDQCKVHVTAEKSKVFVFLAPQSSWRVLGQFQGQAEAQEA